MASRFLLGALSALPLTHAHMQMSNPSPFRDPHANRPNEPKDYNILNPLHADGSDFACKGYHLNTPWTTTATYEAGGTYKMQLTGSATHGGGSCQLSMSFDEGKEFRVIKSIEGGCPEKKEYSFTVPPELAKGGRKRGLFAWTWFNKIGNREMYMNCAPVEIVPKDNDKRDDLSEHVEARDVQKTNAAAQASLSSYPPLFVANLKSVNDCVTKETQDVVFDTPGKSVDFADGVNRSGKPSFGASQCTGKGGKNAGSSSPSSPQGQWQPTTPSNTGSPSNCNDGQYHEECHGGPSSQKVLSGSTASASASAKPAQQAQAQQSSDQQQVQDVKTGKKPSPKVEQELDAYLKNLYGGSRPSKRDACSSTKPPTGGCSSPGRWMRKGECTWSCERQGKTISTPTKSATSQSKESKEVASNLKTLGADMSAMVQLILAKRSTTSTGAKDVDANLARLNTDITRLVEVYVKGATTSKQTEANLKAFQTSLNTLVQGITPRKTSRLVKRQDALIVAPPAPSSFDLFLAYLARLQTTVIECIRNLTTTDSSGSTLLNSTALVNSTFAVIDAAANVQSALKPVQKRRPDVPTKGWFDAADLPADELESDTVFTGMRRLGLDFERLYDSLRPEGSGEDTSDMEFLTIPLGMAKDDSSTHTLQKRQNTGWFDAADLPDDELADDDVFTGMRDLGLDYERLYDSLRPEGDGGDTSDMQFLTVPLGMAKDDAVPHAGLPARKLAPVVAASNSSSNPLQDAADQAAFEAALAKDEMQNEHILTNSTSKPETKPDVDALPPFFLGPGPSAPPGLESVWPATNEGEHVGNLEDMPMVVNDLGPGAEEEVKQFFANLAKEAGASGAEGEKDGRVARRLKA
ncbi:hypothetical protein HBI57_058090 [Parastagonospora nodorum]|nr:hypothetical protein HBI57_058090 [Parastagonospora nodorum]KAH6476726.1 hypothetical protein HBI58_111990 [Parastagonospora nodorum]